MHYTLRTLKCKKRVYEFLANVSDKQKKDTWLIQLSINILSIILYLKCLVPRPPSTIVVLYIIII